MKITVIRIKKLSAGKMRAFVDIALDGLVVIKGAKIFEGPSGLFAALPTQKGKDEKYSPTVEISDSILKSEFNRVCLEAYGPADVVPSAEMMGKLEDAGLVGDQTVPF